MSASAFYSVLDTSTKLIITPAASSLPPPQFSCCLSPSSRITTWCSSTVSTFLVPYCQPGFFLQTLRCFRRGFTKIQDKAKGWWARGQHQLSPLQIHSMSPLEHNSLSWSTRDGNDFCSLILHPLCECFGTGAGAHLPRLARWWRPFSGCWASLLGAISLSSEV